MKCWKELKERASTVFNAPCREAVYAADEEKQKQIKKQRVKAYPFLQDDNSIDGKQIALKIGYCKA